MSAQPTSGARRGPEDELPKFSLDAASVAAVAKALAEMRPDERALLDADGAARLLNLPASFLLREARSDRVPHVRIGRYVRFDRGDLLAWAEARSRGPRVKRVDLRPVSEGRERQC